MVWLIFDKILYFSDITDDKYARNDSKKGKIYSIYIKPKLFYPINDSDCNAMVHYHNSVKKSSILLY